jgi:large subunit ribosomal protein L1
MGKKRISVLGSEDEQTQKAKKAVQLEQKKLREGKSAKAPGLKGGQRVVDTTAESLAEYEEIQKRSSSVTTPEATPTKKPQIKVRSEAYKIAKSKIDVNKTYTVSDALKLLKQINLTKFDPTVELHITLANGSFSQTIRLPYSTGKVRRIAIANDATLSQIESGKIDFDVLLACPKDMPKLVKLAKILGPKGLMPNPKNNTIVNNPEETAKKMSDTISIDIKTEKSAPIIHTVVGKLSQPEKELTANIEAVLKSLSQISKIVLKTTMSPAIKLATP